MAKTMTTKERIKQVLEKWGFPILEEKESSVVFRYQMSYIQAIINGSEDTNAISVTFSGIFSADDEEEMNLGLRACNELNADLLHVKLYIDSEGDLVIAAEFFHKTPEDIEYLLSMALQLVIVAKKRFLQRYREIEDEAKLAADLEQE